MYFKSSTKRYCCKCGEIFSPKAKDQRFCSRNCAVVYNNSKYKISFCSNCGLTFNNKKRSQRFCSLGCALKGQIFLILKGCFYCGEEFEVKFSRHKTAKYCSKKCQDSSKSGELNTKCSQCSKLFHVRPSYKIEERSLGYFCSKNCCNLYKSIYYLGQNNPNAKPEGFIHCDDYLRTIAPNGKKMKVHQVVVLNYLELGDLPYGYVIHHRDCNKLNNAPENLVLVSSSDHAFIHQQFGVAPLVLYLNNEVSLDLLCKYCNNPERAKRLLPISIVDQKAVVFKFGEFRETSEKDNPELSFENGDVQVSKKVQRIDDEGPTNNSSTSAEPN